MVDGRTGLIAEDTASCQRTSVGGGRGGLCRLHANAAPPWSPEVVDIPDPQAAAICSGAVVTPSWWWIFAVSTRSTCSSMAPTRSGRSSTERHRNYPPPRPMARPRRRGVRHHELRRLVPPSSPPRRDHQRRHLHHTGRSRGRRRPSTTAGHRGRHPIATAATRPGRLTAPITDISAASTNSWSAVDRLASLPRSLRHHPRGPLSTLAPSGVDVDVELGGQGRDRSSRRGFDGDDPADGDEPGSR